jgi:exodeoxyribonuclease VII small subunit
MPRSRRQDSPLRADSSATTPPGRAHPATSNPESCASDLNFNEARAALELVLAELQASDLDVEAMAGLYQRGRAYAQRCETILDQVEQEVLIWNDLANPDASPLRYEPEPDPT